MSLFSTPPDWPILLLSSTLLATDVMLRLDRGDVRLRCDTASAANRGVVNRRSASGAGTRVALGVERCGSAGARLEWSAARCGSAAARLAAPAPGLPGGRAGFGCSRGVTAQGERGEPASSGQRVEVLRSPMPRERLPADSHYDALGSSDCACRSRRRLLVNTRRRWLAPPLLGDDRGV